MYQTMFRNLGLSLLVLSSLFFAPLRSNADEPLSLNRAEALELIANTPILFIVDVRSPEEYAAGHVEGAVNLPRTEFEQRLAELPANRPVLIYCASGKRSGEAYAIAREQRPELLLLFVATEGLL